MGFITYGVYLGSLWPGSETGMSDRLPQHMYTDGSGLGQAAGGFSLPEGQRALGAIASLGTVGELLHPALQAGETRCTSQEPFISQLSWFRGHWLHSTSPKLDFGHFPYCLCWAPWQTVAVIDS